MTGVVVSANGVGGVTINIPTQMSVLTCGTRIITDGFTASDVADKIEISEGICDIMRETAGLQTTEGVTSMLGNVVPTECQVFNANLPTWTPEQTANNGWATLTEGQPFTSALGATSVTGTGALATLDSTQKTLGDTMQGFVGACTSAANDTLVAGMNQLIGIAGAGDVAGIQAACSATPFPNPALGGVIQGAQHLQKFADITKQMNSTQSELGGAMAAVKSITKNAPMLSAMGKLAEGIAAKCGMPAPPSMDDAFNCLSNGIVGDSLSVLNTGMSCVSAVANLPAYSGQLDDINDLVWQGSSLGASGIATPFAAAAGFCTSVPAPSWSTSNTIKPSVRISPPERLLVSNGQASAKCTVNASGVITALEITKAGQGYESTPTVTIDPPANGTAATATCTIDASGSVNSITLTSAGTGYTAGGAFPEGTSLSDALPVASKAIIDGAETAKALIGKALGPISDLGNAACGAAGAFGLSSAMIPNLNTGLENLYQKAAEQLNEMSPSELAAAKAAAEARRAQAEADH
jgi:hypothetical protein